MGTPSGIRLRKYHGFYHSIPGRSETAFLTDLEIICNGVQLWPHRYQSPEGPIDYPDPERLQGVRRAYRNTADGPLWTWEFSHGSLFFSVSAHRPGGILLAWRWSARRGAPARLSVRPFFAMRDLHAIGGKTWRWKDLGHGHVAIVREAEELQLQLEGDLQWREDPKWYHSFHYSEELARGYSSEEHLYSDGVLEGELRSGQEAQMVLAEDPEDLFEFPVELPVESSAPLLQESGKSLPVMDFVVTRPAGVVAGFPWFGEWGRDSFVSLPGIVGSWLDAEEDPDAIWQWSKEVLDRWGDWIRLTGMLPNLIEKNGSHQWESADATLWWTHSLAALWSLSLSNEELFPGLIERYAPMLDSAISSIRMGRHLFLKENEQGLLEVTEGHTTWMDARIEGAPVTDRVGLLPEINALWFQARVLQEIWRPGGMGSGALKELTQLGIRTLRIQERHRPNPVFLHSLPLAPSFVLHDSESLIRDLEWIRGELCTPVGLRTLGPGQPGYLSRCEGNQEARDRAYHQGLVWAWLGGHFEMAEARLPASRRKKRKDEKMFSAEILKSMPIRGQIPEIFDAEEPFTPRGAPAQAWSLATLEEARVRRRWKLDARVAEVLAQRWLEKGERPGSSASSHEIQGRVT